MVHHSQETFCHIGMLSSPLLLQFQVHGDHTNSRDKLHHRLRSGSTGPGVSGAIAITQKSDCHIRGLQQWQFHSFKVNLKTQLMMKMITLMVMLAALLFKLSYPSLPLKEKDDVTRRVLYIWINVKCTTRHDFALGTWFQACFAHLCWTFCWPWPSFIHTMILGSLLMRLCAYGLKDHCH